MWPSKVIENDAGARTISCSETMESADSIETGCVDVALDRIYPSVFMDRGFFLFVSNRFYCDFCIVARARMAKEAINGGCRPLS